MEMVVLATHSTDATPQGIITSSTSTTPLILFLRAIRRLIKDYGEETYMTISELARIPPHQWHVIEPGIEAAFTADDIASFYVQLDSRDNFE
jgi:hypothetical protein